MRKGGVVQRGIVMPVPRKSVYPAGGVQGEGLRKGEVQMEQIWSEQVQTEQNRSAQVQTENAGPGGVQTREVRMDARL